MLGLILPLKCSATKATPVWHVPCQVGGTGIFLANEALSGQMPVSRTPITVPAPVAGPGLTGLVVWSEGPPAMAKTAPRR